MSDVVEVVQLVSLKDLGRLEKDVKIGPLVVKLHTLSQMQQETALTRIPKTEDDNMRVVMGQAAILTEATTSYNGTALDKDVLFSVYRDSQTRLIDELFSAYLALLAEQNTLFEELKKN